MSPTFQKDLGDDYVIRLAYVPRKHLKCPNMTQRLATNVKWKIMHKNECKNVTLREQQQQ